MKFARHIFSLLLPLCIIGSASCSSPEYYDIVVVGGGASGTAAAVQASRSGREDGLKVLLLEETPWLGGMLTSAGVSATDGCHLLCGGFWKEFRDSLEAEYGSPEALQSGWVSNTLFEPAIGARIFENIASACPNLTVLHGAVGSSFEKDSAGGWNLVYLDAQGRSHKCGCRIMMDATELGDVAAAVGVPYDLGFDSGRITGEPSAPVDALDIVQDLTYVATIRQYDHDVTIPRPQGYDRNLYLRCCNSDFWEDNDIQWSADQMLLYGKTPRGEYMINWPNHGNDFYANLIDKSATERAALIEAAKQHTLGFVYFLQTELGYCWLGLSDEYPTEDRLPLIPYYRESRRIHGTVRLDQNDITYPYCDKERPLYRTGIAVGDYPVDHHHKAYRGDIPLPKLDFHPVPSYNVPMGVMIPEGVEDFLVIEKSISVTNIVNGSTRLQPVVLQIGQAAGILAASALKNRTALRNVPVRRVQSALLEAGAYIAPIVDVTQDDPRFKPLQRVAVTGLLRYRWHQSGWTNTSLMEIDAPLLAGDLKEGLEDYYGKPLCGRAFEGIGDSEPLSRSRFLDIVLTLEPEAEIAPSDNCGSPALLTRGEAALLLDRYLDIFGSFETDITGKIIKRK
ncbi:MAG: FAD-dependent oxidoreductase [Bacteroidales bacterium]|nr:FAD-dependent oxidoreductase [Bacteroidales bacterium]